MKNWLNKFRENEALIIIVLIGAFLRLYHIGFQSAWLDELNTMMESNPNLTFEEFKKSVVFWEGMPHLYFLITRFLSTFFSYNIITVRLVSVFFGVLSIYYIYKLGHKIFNKNVGLISAGFLTVNIFHIEYSQEARSYSMLMFFVIISFYQLLIYLKKKTLLSAILLGVFCGLITNAHPIGILNVMSIYLIILIHLIVFKKDRIMLLKYSVISAIVSFIVFLPTLETILTVSKITNFWITEASIDYLIQTYQELFGKSLFLSWLFLIFYISFWLISIREIVKSNFKTVLTENKLVLSFLVLNIWLLFEVIVIIIKSYVGVSIILHRYFIAVVPACILIMAITVEHITNGFLKRAVLYGTTIFMLINIFFIRDYYNVITKAQFDLAAKNITDHNMSKHKVVSSWNWLMGYYFNEKNGIFTEGKELNAYIDAIRNGKQNPASFWYIDGNSKPMQLSVENEAFLNGNYIIKNKLEVYDAWSAEFKSKHNESMFIDLHNFKPSLFDGSGAMIFIENKKSYYPKIDLEKGDYILSFTGFSLPEKPINGENAHFNVFINGKKATDFNFYTMPNQAIINIPFFHKGGQFNLILEYDNDIVIENEDRNAVITNMTLKKK